MAMQIKPRSLHIKKRRLLLGVLVIILALAGVEQLARQWRTSHPDFSYRDFRMTRPLAYKYSSYWSPDFMRTSDEGYYDYDHPGYWTRQDYHSAYYNVVNGNRHTTNQPQDAEHTVYVFGSSQVFAGEVADQFTIPSRLQARLGDQYRVENLGMNGYMTTNEFARLKDTPIRPGDIVIFYDGIVDVTTPFHDALLAWDEHTLCMQLLNSLDRLAVIHLMCDWIYYAKIDPTTIDYESVYTHYASTISSARQYAVSKRARFYHFLQPQIWSKPLSAYEHSVAYGHNWTQEGEDYVITHIWPRFESLSDTIDLTHAVDALRNSGVEIYFDPIHMNEQGNDVLAEAMYDAIIPF